MTRETDAGDAAARGPRRYQKRLRAQHEAGTRRRIVAAALQLLDRDGPTGVTVSGVARAAGVQRLTVYRHFPGGAGIVEACAAERAERHPLPDPAEWAAIADPAKRLRRALRRLYAHYRERGSLGPAGATLTADGPAASHAAWLDGVLGTVAHGWTPRAKRGELLDAALRHAVRYETWRSLCLPDDGLDDKAAARLMVRMVRSVARRDR